jgi:lipid-A-disaccharide synthase
LKHHAKGHPLPGAILPRETRSVPSADGGLVGLMPGSRKQEVTWILPVMLAAMQLLRKKRPALRARVVAANPEFYTYLQSRVSEYPWIDVVHGSSDSLCDVDAALIKSGTAVLEAALRSVPTVAMYVLSPTLAWIVRNIFHFRSGFVTLPNLVLEREIVLERLQEAAVPETLADDVDRLLADPHTQLADFAELRLRLGGSDVIDQWAQIALNMLPKSDAVRESRLAT